MSLVGNTSVAVSEVLLSLYPILVKVVPLNFDTGLLARFAVFTAVNQFTSVKYFYLAYSSRQVGK